MKKPINEILGERVKAQRKSQGYTRESFAEEIEVSTRFLADLEGGKVGVSISTLKAIALKLNVSSDYLIGLTSPDELCLVREQAVKKLNRIPDTHIEKVNTILSCIADMTE